MFTGIYYIYLRAFLNLNNQKKWYEVVSDTHRAGLIAARILGVSEPRGDAGDYHVAIMKPTVHLISQAHCEGVLPSYISILRG